MVITERQRRLIIYVTITCIAYLLAVIAIDVAIVSAVIRHLVISGLGLAVIVIVAGLAIMTVSRQKRWKHIYKPMRYDTDQVPFLRDHIGKDVVPVTYLGYQERVKASLWLREAVAEYVELNWTRSPYDFSRMMTTPDESDYLKDRPALRKMLADLQDLGVYKDKSTLYLRRREYLKLVDKIFKEVGVA